MKMRQKHYLQVILKAVWIHKAITVMVKLMTKVNDSEQEEDPV